MKTLKTLLITVGCTVVMSSYAQQDSLIRTSFTSSSIVADEVYRYKPKLDIPITAATIGWTTFGFSKIYNKPSVSEATINALSVNDIPRFDRWAADIYNEKAADVSDYIFYGSIPVPLLLLADKSMRKDFGKITLLYLEAMGITGTVYTGGAYLFDRYRPYAYNPTVGMGDKTEGNARNAFPAGHPALVGTATFFAAKVFSDYHPESKFKWLAFTGAGVATGLTAYLRHRGGRHFPSDLLVGTTTGVLAGILVPHFHKNKLFKNTNMSLIPYTGQSHGLLFTYKM